MTAKPKYILLVGALLCFQCFVSGWSFWKPQPPSPSSATFSPDGQHLVFPIEENSKRNIYQIRIDGSGLTRLTTSPSRDSYPAYSPDGTKIVFSRILTSKYSDPSSLYLMNSDGTNVARLTSDTAADMAPFFSPDGQLIYFVRAKWFGHRSPLVSSSWKKKDIYSIKPDGSDLKAITHESFYGMSSPSISWDGKEILASLTVAKKMDSLWIIPIDRPKKMWLLEPNWKGYFRQNNPKRLAKASADQYFHGPQFSPDKKSLIFNWAETTDNKRGYYIYEIYIMDLESHSIRKLTHLNRCVTAPYFSANGKEIVFLFDPSWPRGKDPDELWMMNSDGTNPHRIPIDLKNCVNCHDQDQP